MQSKRLLFAALAFLLLGVVQMMAQEQKGFKVESCVELEGDITAQNDEYEDENGDKCDLFKIHTTLDDLVIKSGDAYGIVHIDRNNFNTTGEIWVYVPRDLSVLRFKHKSAPELRYTLPKRTGKETATVYSMVLKNEGGTFLAFTILPKEVMKDAKVYVDENEIERNEDGTFSMGVEKGKHTYRIEVPDYDTFEGEETFTDDKPKFVTAEMKRQFSFLNVASFPTGASVFVNDEPVGVTDYTSGRMKLGQYSIRLEKEDYFPIDSTITLTAEKDFDFLVPLESSLPPAEGRRTLVMLEAGYHPSQISFGAMVGMVETNGAYLRFRSDFGSASTDLECDDTGNLTAGGTGIPYYKEGATTKSRMSITAGYLRRLAKPLYMYVGAGYGSRTLAWETIDGELVKNTDHSATGIAGEIGAIGRFGKFALSVGYQTVNFKYHEASLGIGFMF
ncbi:MAG: PEGA domain-containing protein [Bacteroides sp.]|nr:PEGA domain-containing protein [Roseburia sp.]MCM1346114.1 PEGA domain-containing protein [Bacteroides sp.]MCM1421192.1 PEGA domain-containing protein [Bacteroides sp.]